MAQGLIALGSNLGDRAQQLRKATAELSRLPGTRLIARSRWHETLPIGGPAGQGTFLNAAALLATTLSPTVLLAELRRIEATLGRVGAERWAARSLDLDLLLYDAQTVQTAALEVPHPRMAFRRFVLEPAVEVAPWMIHPDSGWTVAALLRRLNHGAETVAVAAADEADAAQLVSQLADRLKAPVAAREPSAVARPQIRRWLPDVDVANARQPKLIVAVGVSAGTDTSALRKMLHLPVTGPIAWIPPGADAATEALAAVQSVWPALAT